MIAQRSKLFRKEALERNASPEQLDQLVQIVNPKRWLSLIALGGLVSGGVAWSILGQIPITVQGQGILTYPSQVAPLQSSASGRIKEILIEEGDLVNAGDVIALLDQSELEKQLELAKLKLSQLQDQENMANLLQNRREASERIATEQQRRSLQQQLTATQALTPILQSKAQASIQQERSALQTRADALQPMLVAYQKRWENRQRVNERVGEIVISSDEILQAEQAYRDIHQELNQIQTQLSQLALEEANAQQEYAQNLNKITDLQAQLRALDSQSATQVEQDLIASTNRQKEIQEIERAITQLTLKLSHNQEIVSPQTGRILELSVQAGQYLDPSIPVGVIGTYEENQTPVSIAFLPVEEGMKVREKMSLQITPTTVKREEYGGILGEVTEVSAFPVTQQEAIDLVGHADILPGIMTEGPHIAIYAQLATYPSTQSCEGKYQWSSSKGPADQCFAPGTTTQVQITVEKRRPLSFVLPILKEWTGIN